MSVGSELGAWYAQLRAGCDEQGRRSSGTDKDTYWTPPADSIPPETSGQMVVGRVVGSVEPESEPLRIGTWGADGKLRVVDLANK